jgi:hypothetical protein
MGKIASKLVLVYLLSMQAVPIAWVLQYGLTFINTPEQDHLHLVLNIIAYILFLILGTAIFVVYAKELDEKFRRYTKLSDSELIKLATKTINLPYFIFAVFFIIYFTVLITIIGIGFYIKASLFTNLSTFFMGMAGLLQFLQFQFFFWDF